ncbi:hypothetical protein [Roseobacter ponti]|uniref:Uncharacterized protein n=1 Tax=Roseobacter ponti TaxID=1891787 RepID=A0A858SUM4_9RHOB|nr:hypothetical protein [Roseobacter ponti]QJF52659.1 hypothetical protein G3256_16515 [Roseobacter ponti]
MPRTGEIAADDISPELEDRGLFRTYGGPVAVELIPQLNRLSATNLIVRGFFEKETEIAVVFAGRRARETGPLEAHLRWVDGRVRQAAVASKRPVPPVEFMRLPVQIKGSWRKQFFQDDEGNETRTYQLVAGRWAFSGQDGKLQQFGAPPACDISTRNRPKSYILRPREIDAVQVGHERDGGEGGAG